MKWDEPRWVTPSDGMSVLLLSGRTEQGESVNVLVRRKYDESTRDYEHPPLNVVVSSFLFHHWITYVDDRFRFKMRDVPLAGKHDGLYTIKAGRIVIQSVDMFGDRIGFIKLKADFVDEQGNDIPGIVFLRGDAAAVLVVLTCEGKSYTVLVNQPRAATGKFDFCEIPAGMLDGSGDFIGTAAKELQEETGISIKRDELVHLGGFYASPGACDERIGLSYIEREVDRLYLNKLNGRCTGAADEGERITLRVVPLGDLPMFAGRDMKSMLAHQLYESMVIEKTCNMVLSTLRSIGKGKPKES